MAEAGDRPRPDSSGATAGEKVWDSQGEASVYRPISLLAVASLGLGGLFCAVVIVGGIVSFLAGTPMLWPLWTLVWPLTVMALALIALRRIRLSEGTLAGAGMARWSLASTVLVGLSYWAYYGVTWYLISGEAERFATEFLNQIVDGQIDQAFLLTMPPPTNRKLDPAARNDLEVRFNTPSERGEPGPLTLFSRSDMVRLLSEGGPPLQMVCRGVITWTYDKGFYNVSLSYKVKNRIATFGLAVTVQGGEAAHREFEGRQWKVDRQQSGIISLSSTTPQVPILAQRDIILTPEGQQMLDQIVESARVLDKWRKNLAEGRAEAAYWTTELPEKRQKLLPIYSVAVVSDALALAGPPASLLPSPVAMAANAGVLPGLPAGVSAVPRGQFRSGRPRHLLGGRPGPASKHDRADPGVFPPRESPTEEPACGRERPLSDSA